MKPGIYLTRTNMPSLGGNTLAPAGDERLEALVLTGWSEAPAAGGRSDDGRAAGERGGKVRAAVGGGAAPGGERSGRASVADEFDVVPPADSRVAATHIAYHFAAAGGAAAAEHGGGQSNPVLVVLLPFIGSERKAKQIAPQQRKASGRSRGSCAGIVMPSQESELTITNPGDVIASTYYMRARECDAGALREELWSVKAKLELAETKAVAAGALAEKAREVYERDREDMRCVVLYRYQHLNLARIVVTLSGDEAGTSAARCRSASARAHRRTLPPLASRRPLSLKKRREKRREGEEEKKMCN
ncbi:hypothetical protein [Oryza sativa Japonica Group]|uniref:DUF1263 domain-containing protein n=1 Tax=Oryza sativa subsp. japonica TaxID=39947 RepID=Q5JLI5_ORYSJ|nr:hypothetical protein [Oryza sativa Japonica Group]